jgi:hypothetical protein
MSDRLIKTLYRNVDKWHLMQYLGFWRYWWYRIKNVFTK